MLRYIALCLVLAVAAPAPAQWATDGKGSKFTAFGVHDTTMFAGHQMTFGWDAYLERYSPYSPDPPLDHWFGADDGIQRGIGDIFSFASLGHYFFANQKDNQAGNYRPYRSSDNGGHWVSLRTYAPVGTVGRYLLAQSVTLNLDGGGLPYPFLIDRSTDSGLTWDSVALIGRSCNINTFCALGKNAIACAQLGTFYSRDEGLHWLPATTPYVNVTSCVAMGETLFASDLTHLLISTDSGATWQASPTSFNVLTLAVVVSKGRSYLFAGGSDGLYLRDTLGLWHETGLKGKNVDLLCQLDTTLFAQANTGTGTYDHYLYYRPIAQLTDSALSAVAPTQPLASSLELYPNPSTGFVSIAANEEIAGIDVMNILGVSVLSQTAVRSTSATLDLSHLPAGSYFIRITTSTRTEMRRVVRE